MPGSNRSSALWPDRIHRNRFGPSCLVAGAHYCGAPGYLSLRCLFIAIDSGRAVAEVVSQACSVTTRVCHTLHRGGTASLQSGLRCGCLEAGRATCKLLHARPRARLFHRIAQFGLTPARRTWRGIQRRGKSLRGNGFPECRNRQANLGRSAIGTQQRVGWHCGRMLGWQNLHLTSPVVSRNAIYIQHVFMSALLRFTASVRESAAVSYKDIRLCILLGYTCASAGIARHECPDVGLPFGYCLNYLGRVVVTVIRAFKGAAA